MSDSEPDNLPSDATIERTLRHAVQAIHKSGKEEDLTVKRVRTRAEQELHLPLDFLKSDKTWKGRSSTIIKDAVVSTLYWLRVYLVSLFVNRTDSILE